MLDVNPAVAAIEYAINDDSPKEFLQCWFEGDFEALREEWEDVPEAVFIGADSLHPETQLEACIDTAEVRRDAYFEGVMLSLSSLRKRGDTDTATEIVVNAGGYKGLFGYANKANKKDYVETIEWLQSSVSPSQLMV